MKVQQYKDTLLECLVTLRHARTFVTSREKMHPTGVELYDKLIIDVENALKAPEPASAQETGCEHGVKPPFTCARCVAAETKSAPDNSGVCPVCGWPTGHCNIGCTAAANHGIKIGDRVRLAIGNTMLPIEGWTVYRLPTPEWRSYGLKHDSGGDMSINGEYVVPV